MFDAFGLRCPLDVDRGMIHLARQKNRSFCFGETGEVFLVQFVAATRQFEAGAGARPFTDEIAITQAEYGPS